MKINRITILGDGGWGTTLSSLLAKKGFSVTLWSVSKKYAEFLKKKRRNVKFLPDVIIPRSIKITSELKDAVLDADLVVLAVPSEYLRIVLKRINPKHLKGKVIVSAVKGIEKHTLMRMSEVIKDVLGNVKLAILSGPTIAHEVANNIPTTAVIASADTKLNNKLQQVFMTRRFRVYTNNDIIGVETGGSIKNIIAIACGICDGLGFGTNTKAAVLSRGLAEMSRLGITLGAKAKTFFGISGLGDLVTTCASIYSRNRSLGEAIGKGKKLKQIVSHMNMVAEGVPTTKSVYALSRKYKVDMPITREVYLVLYENKKPLSAVDALMTRRGKHE